jgi:putative ABC transport system permease protein
MLKNYFRIAWRNLIKNKAHSTINILGLSAGMAVAMLIGLWIFDEWSFDRANPHFDRIARVRQNVTNNGEVQTWSNMPYPLANELRKNYGGDFKRVVMGIGQGSHILSFGDKQLRNTGSYFEPAITDLLNLTMIKGRRDGLNDPSSILLSQSLAKSIFGDADPLNKVLKIDNQEVVKVTGVYADMPDNSSFAEMSFIAPWDLFFSNTGWIRTIQDPWRPNVTELYVELADNADLSKVSVKIKDAKLNKVSKELAKKKPELFLQGMGQWHLYSTYKDGVNTGGRITYVWLFGIIGAFVLLLACINFMNLSTARSEKRAKEVGIRKAIGSLRGQLIGQFFSESFLVVIFSFLLSLLLVEGALPFFNSVADKKISILWANPTFWMLSIGFSLVTALIAGSYPAFYLSSFRPVAVLKGTFRSGPGAAIPRKVLVVLQFTVSIVMIIGTIVVFHQIRYAKDRPVGYSRDGLVSVPTGTPDIHTHFNAVRDELVKAGAITGMAEAGSSTTQTAGSTSGIDWKGKNPNLSVDFLTAQVSYDYGKTIGWHFSEGRDFSKDFATDSSGLVLNESAIRFMGLKNPVGETIR